MKETTAIAPLYRKGNWGSKRDMITQHSCDLGLAQGLLSPSPRVYPPPLWAPGQGCLHTGLVVSCTHILNTAKATFKLSSAMPDTALHVALCSSLSDNCQAPRLQQQHSLGNHYSGLNSQKKLRSKTKKPTKPQQKTKQTETPKPNPRPS